MYTQTEAAGIATDFAVLASLEGCNSGQIPGVQGLGFRVRVKG